jgi:hypothetical protein
MIRKFYEKVLPTQGVYCVTSINPTTEKARNQFTESLDGVIDLIDQARDGKNNVFVAPASFNGYSRKLEDVLYQRSFFVDLDVGEGKEYSSKQEALLALEAFIEAVELPEPVRIDSGRGVHAYWPIDTDVPVSEWKSYAEKFKDLCISNDLHIDPVVTANPNRIMRCPDTMNYKDNPPLPTKILGDEENIPVYSFDEFKQFLGEVDPTFDEILANIPKGMSADQLAMSRIKDYSANFQELALMSLEGNGCAQVKYALENAAHLPEPVWRATLSLAANCEDRDTAIHMMSEDYVGYNPDEVEYEAKRLQGKPFLCETFNNEIPGKCDGCPHRGKLKPANPLGLVTKLQIAQISDAEYEQKIAEVAKDAEGAVRLPSSPKALPEGLYPFVGSPNGGVYYVPPAKYNAKTGATTAEQPIPVTRYDLYPVKRIYSVIDGECLLMRTDLPNDASREFLIPMKHVYATERLKEIMASNGVLFSPGNGDKLLMSYLVKWGEYLVHKKSAEVMRMQMGWTEDKDAFVVGNKEIKKNGEVVHSPTSPLCRSIAQHLKPAGSYEQWKAIAKKLNSESLEYHAFTMLTGFGSVLMPYTSTSGVTMCLSGKSGVAKTGALYGALSIWGNPKDMSVVGTDNGATQNGLMGRYLGLHNIPFGLDEVHEMHPKELAGLLHKIAQGKSKIRMQASINAERPHELAASLIAIFTSNDPIYDILMGHKKSPTGEIARLINFEIPKPKLLVDDPSQGKGIFDEFNRNYGWAGPEFIKAVYKYTEEEIRALIDKWIMRFKKDFGDLSEYRFYENLVGVGMGAGEITNQAGITELDLERIYSVIVRQIIRIKDNVVKVNEVDYEAMLGDYVNNRTMNTLIMNDGRVTLEPRGPLLVRAEVDTGKLYVSKPDFRKYLIENNISTNEFMFQMQSMNVTIDDKKTRIGAGWKEGLKLQSYCYIIDTQAFDNNFLKNLAKDESAGA